MLAVCVWLPAQAGEEGNTVKSLLEANQAVQSMSCEVRRESRLGGQTVSTLSRVWFARGDRLMVETQTPLPRRILVDGTTIYKWVEGQESGVRIPIEKASAGETVQLRRVPGTGEEFLLRLRNLPEETLPAQDGLPVRRGYTPPAPAPYTVIALNAQGRLASVEFFDADTRATRLLTARFLDWREAAPGCWFARVQKTETHGQSGVVREDVVRVSRIVPNGPANSSRFDVSQQAIGVSFISQEAMAEALRSQSEGKAE